MPSGSSVLGLSSKLVCCVIAYLMIQKHWLHQSTSPSTETLTQHQTQKRSDTEVIFASCTCPSRRDANLVILLNFFRGTVVPGTCRQRFFHTKRLFYSGWVAYNESVNGIMMAPGTAFKLEGGIDNFYCMYLILGCRPIG